MDHRLDGRNPFFEQRIFYNNILKRVIIHLTKLFSLFKKSIVYIIIYIALLKILSYFKIPKKMLLDAI